MIILERKGAGNELKLRDGNDERVEVGELVEQRNDSDLL